MEKRRETLRKRYAMRLKYTEIRRHFGERTVAHDAGDRVYCSLVRFVHGNPARSFVDGSV